MLLVDRKNFGLPDIDQLRPVTGAGKASDRLDPLEDIVEPKLGSVHLVTYQHGCRAIHPCVAMHQDGFPFCVSVGDEGKSAVSEEPDKLFDVLCFVGFMIAQKLTTVFNSLVFVAIPLVGIWIMQVSWAMDGPTCIWWPIRYAWALKLRLARCHQPGIALRHELRRWHL